MAAEYLAWSDVPVGSTVQMGGRPFTVAHRTDDPLTVILHDGKRMHPGTPNPDSAVRVMSRPLPVLPDLWGSVVFTGTSEIIPDVMTAILQGIGSGMAVRVTVERNPE